MTQEEKAKAYDEAIERAKSFELPEYKNIMESVFPELKESEDERIKKALCKAIWTYIPTEEGQEYIAWLEKQGNKSVNIDIESMVSSYEQRLKSQCDIKNSPILNMCLTAFRRGVENTLEELNLKELEKQGEQKPYGRRKECLDCQFNYAGECKGFCAMKRSEQNSADKAEPKDYSNIDPYFGKPVDKAEPKFHEGEWVTNGDYTWKIVEVKPLDYILQSQDGNIVDDTISYVDEQFHSFTLEDANDGDVLFMDNEVANCIFIYKSSNNGIINKYASYNNFGFEGEHYLVLNNGYVIPANKKQRDTLLKAMDDAGYTFDFEKKRLKKIEQKPAWNEDDERHLNTTIAYLKDAKEFKKTAEKCIYWLKSLKQRIGG